ncbi:MAG: threonine synthase, partial [Ruthenibacterium sp.]
MQYTSTRDDTVSADASAAILTGLAPDGGLFVPTSFPALNVTECYGLSYPETAQKVLQLFLSDYDSAFLQEAVTQTYSDANFDGKAGFVKKISDDRFALELWHGPTCAFKDYALQLMPKLLCEAKKLQKDTGMTKILVATSGDTGKAALAGYANLSGIKIAVFYPNDGTSTMQRLQMATQEG